MSVKEQKNTKEYKSLLTRIGNCFTQLNSEYISAQNQQGQLKEAWFAYGIIKVLLQNASSLLSYGSLRSKQDLVDSVETHYKKYIEVFQNAEHGRETALIFQTNITNLISSCNNNKSTSSLNAQEHDIIRDLVTDLLHKSQSLFGEQSYNQDTVDKLQASSIVFNLFELPIKQQMLLLDKLLLTKELWQIEDYSSDKQTDFKMAFNSDPIQILTNVQANDGADAFTQLSNIFIEEKNILQNISNERMIDLYDRLKNFEPQTEIFNNILNKLHREAQFRYGHNRLSDSGYELLKRFQSCDAIVHQIENAEFAIVESFLIKKNTFLQETINTLSKHVDNIKAIGAAKLPEVKNVMSKLSKQITNAHLEEHLASTTLNSMVNKLSTGIDSHIYKRYTELDKFAVSLLKSKYESFFQNLNQLLDNAYKTKDFLQQVIVRKLAQDYHVSNLSNSALKLKATANERTEIAKQLSEIDFVELFNQEHINNITSLNLRKNVKEHSSSPFEYVQSLVNVIVTQSSASQLESLYRPLKNDLSEIQSLLKQDIVKQIKQRTTVTKMLYSIFTGKKKDFDKLKDIKNDLKPSFSQSIGASEFEKIKNTPNEMKKEIENLAKKNAENEGMINKVKTVDTDTETLNN